MVALTVTHGVYGTNVPFRETRYSQAALSNIRLEPSVHTQERVPYAKLWSPEHNDYVNKETVKIDVATQRLQQILCRATQKRRRVSVIENIAHSFETCLREY